MALLGSRRALLALAVAARRVATTASAARAEAPAAAPAGRRRGGDVEIERLRGAGPRPGAEQRLRRKTRARIARLLGNSNPRPPGALPGNCSVALSRSFCVSSGSSGGSAVSGLHVVQRVLAVSGHAWKEETDEADRYDPNVDPRRFQQTSSGYAELCYGSDGAASPLASPDGAQSALAELLRGSASARPAELAACLQAIAGAEPWHRRDLHRSGRFRAFLDLLSSKVGDMTDRELLATLAGLHRVGLNPRHAAYAEYDAELARRADGLSLEQLLLATDVWRVVGYRSPRVLRPLFERAARDWAALSRPCTVQLLYVVGENRGAAGGLLNRLEQLVARHVGEMSAEEVGACCIAFFKSRHKASAQTMQKIGDKVAAGMHEISDFGLVAVLKMLRLTHCDHVPFLRRLCAVAPARLPAIGVQGVMHVALACAALHYLDEPLMRAVARQVTKRSRFGRSKDLAKLLWAFGSLACELPGATEDMYAALVQLLRERAAQFERHPRHMVTALLALAFTGRFPEDLLSEALSPRYRVLLGQRSEDEAMEDLYTLDTSVGLECPGYSGNRLDEATRREMRRAMHTKLTMAALTRPEVRKALEALAVLLGGSHLARAHAVLPHTRSYDIEIHFDERGVPVPVADDGDGGGDGDDDGAGGEGASTAAVPRQELHRQFRMRSQEATIADELVAQLFMSKVAGRGEPEGGGASRRTPLLESLTRQSGRVPLTASLVLALTNREPPERGSPPPGGGGSGGGGDRAAAPADRARCPARKVAVQVTNQNNYLYRVRRHTGLQAMKRRQLLLRGYTVAEIPYWDWMAMLGEPLETRVAYVERKLNFYGAE